MANPTVRDRDLVRLHWPVELRPAFDALFAVDDAMASVVLGARDLNLSAIKLAWWREQLQALDVSPPPAEPRLQAAATELLPRGIEGGELAELEEGWAQLLQAEPEQEAAAERGARLFGLAARLLGATHADVRPAGAAWALADLARRTGSAEWLRPILSMPRLPRKLRPLGVMTALAMRDHQRGLPIEPEGTPGRSWTLIRYRITGRLQR